MAEEDGDAATNKRLRVEEEIDPPSKFVKSSDSDEEVDKTSNFKVEEEGTKEEQDVKKEELEYDYQGMGKEELKHEYIMDRAGETAINGDNPGHGTAEASAVIHSNDASNPSSNPGTIQSISNPASSNPGTASHNNQSSTEQQQEQQRSDAILPPSTTVAAALPEPTIIEEKDHVSAAFVGRVIGKGGEMIRDLQARAGCRVDVDQNVPEGAPRVITYRGTRVKVDFAKRLVKMLCEEGKRDIDLPLGEASQKHILVPANVIGKIIGRGGEMIRELQNKSQAKIQVHHTASSDMDPNQRKVTVTGTPVSVTKAEEMIHFLTTNPAMDAMTALNMLIEEKSQGRSQWGTGPPYPSMPNGGVGMQGSSYGVPGYQQQQQQQQQQFGGGYYGQQQPAYGAGAAYGQVAAVATAGGYYGQTSAGIIPSAGGEECEIVPCPRTYMGRVIGQKGATINDIQKRSGCDIQINQDVPQGQDCQITVKGSRQGIELAKQMLMEVIEIGPGHSYAGGQGGGGQGSGRHHQQQQAYGVVQQQQYGVAVPQQQPQQGAAVYQQGAAATGYAQHYQQYQQQAYGQQAAVVYGQQQPHYPQAAVAATTIATATYGAYPAGSSYPPAIQEFPWKSASSADGQVYYYNEKTGESQWEKPPGMP